MRLLKQLDELLAHLNGEENSMAEKFRRDPKARLIEADDDSMWRCSLEAWGVDNWSGYDEALSEGGYHDEEDDDE